MVFGSLSGRPPSDEIFQREVEFVFSSLSKVKNNESAWNYLNGILHTYPATLQLIFSKYGFQTISLLTKTKHYDTF